MQSHALEMAEVEGTLGGGDADPDAHNGGLKVIPDSIT